MTPAALLILQLCGDHATSWHQDPAWERAPMSIMESHGDEVLMGTMPWAWDTKSRVWIPDSYQPGFEKCKTLVPELKAQKDREDVEESNRRLAEKNAADAKVLKEAIGKLGP